MAEAIFLSVAVPDGTREPGFATTVDTVAASAAVSALADIVLGRRPLVMRDHPGVSPMLRAKAENAGVDYGRWVRLYRSRHTPDEIPEDDERFRNVVYTDGQGDEEGSLLILRERMFSEQEFKAAVFVGGGCETMRDYEAFSRLQPDAKSIPIVSTGGAVSEIAAKIGGLPSDLADDLDYLRLLHRHLDVSVREDRFETPDEQPEALERRYRRPERRL